MHADPTVSATMQDKAGAHRGAGRHSSSCRPIRKRPAERACQRSHSKRQQTHIPRSRPQTGGVTQERRKGEERLAGKDAAAAERLSSRTAGQARGPPSEGMIPARASH